MKDLATIANEAAKDHRRAQELQRALGWIAQCGEALPSQGCEVDFSTRFGNGVPGYTEAMGMLASAISARTAPLLDEVVKGAHEELEAIVARYRPLLEQPEAGQL